MPDPVTIGLALTAAYAFFKNKGAAVQRQALTTLNQALDSGMPIPGTFTVETIVGELPAGVLKDTILMVTANASDLANRAAMEDEAGVPVDPSEAAAAIQDIQATVEPAALALATMVASSGPELASTKLAQLFPVGVVPIGAMMPGEVVAGLLENLTGAVLSNTRALEASLAVGAVDRQTVDNPDGTVSLVITRTNVDGSILRQEIVSDPAGTILHVLITTTAAGSGADGLPVSTGLPIYVNSPGFQAAQKMFPTWSGRFRALNAVPAPASMYPGGSAIGAGTLLNIVTGG